MQRSLKSLLLLSAVTITIVSCNQNKSALAIPKDASLAVQIHTSSLTSKVTWQEIQQNEWFKKLYNEEADSLGKKILDNPASSGIDLKSDLAVFMKKQGQGGYVAFEGGVQDAAAFETFVTKVTKNEKPVKSGDINVITTDNKSLITWTKNRFVFIADVPMADVANPLSSNSDGRPFSFGADSLQKFAVELYDLPSKNNLSSDDRYTSLLKETGDIHYWVNTESYASSLGGMLSLLKLNVLFEGNAYGATVNFDNGKITFKSKAWYNKQLKDLMNKYGGGKVSEDMINRIPSKEVVAVFAGKYPPAGLKELIKLIGVDGFVNSFFSQVGYSTEEFVKATKGDVLLAVTDFAIKSKALTITDEEGNPHTVPQNEIPDAKILFATSVNDKPSFDKLFAILQNKSKEMGPLTNDVHFQLNNDWFLVGNSPEQINGFISGGNNKFPFTSRISGNAFGGYIDIQKILKAAAPSISDSTSKAAMDLSVSMWQDAVMTSGGEKGDAFVGEAEINLVDKSTNSLKQLNTYFGTLTKLFKVKGKFDAEVKLDDPGVPGKSEVVAETSK